MLPRRSLMDVWKGIMEQYLPSKHDFVLIQMLLWFKYVYLCVDEWQYSPPGQ